MSREEVQKLLGGYATGTLTADEQQALFEAALEDQELFDTLAREQGLRDLLRDPAARAELLAALDERPRGGILAWLRRPMVAGLAMAGLAAIGVVVWRGSHGVPTVSQTGERKIVAELKTEPMKTETDRAPAPPPSNSAPATAEPKPARQRQQVPAVAAPPAASSDESRQKDKEQRVDVVAEAPVLAQPKAAELSFGNQQAQSKLQVQNAAPSPVNQAMQNQMNTVNVQDQRLENARSLFYGGQLPVSGRTAFAETVQVDADASKAAAPKAEKKAAGLRAATGMVAGAGASAGSVGGAPSVAHLGVRCSIVRDGNREADLSTPLYAGESVKLRLTPNADGFLFVSEGEGDATRLVASGPVRRLVPFETPVLKSDAAGQRLFHISLTREAGMTKSGAAGFAPASRANLVETTSDRDPATYVVLGDAAPGAQQFTAPVTLTWR